MEVFLDEESGLEDVKDKVARTFVLYEVQYQLPVSGFISNCTEFQ